MVEGDVEHPALEGQPLGAVGRQLHDRELDQVAAVAEAKTVIGGLTEGDLGRRRPAAGAADGAGRRRADGDHDRDRPEAESGCPGHGDSVP